MMRWIVRTSLRFRFLVLAMGAALIVLGAVELSKTPVDVFPEFAPPTVEVQTEAVGLTPAEVESLVTVPLENALNGVADLDVMRSQSVPQLSQIQLIFKQGTDPLRARELVQERLAVVRPTLPNSAAPPNIIEPKSATSRVMEIGLSSKSMSLTDLSVLTATKIQPRLLRVPGVANVSTWGARDRELQVQVDPARLRTVGLPLDRVMAVTSNALDNGCYASNGRLRSAPAEPSPPSASGCRSVTACPSSRPTSWPTQSSRFATASRYGSAT
jgi:Cu/Ag efflux pump CusA